MSKKTEPPAPDPLQPWIQFWETWSQSWSKALSDTAASEAFAESMGQHAEIYLQATALVRRQMQEVMEQTMHQMSVPTRDDVIRLGERLTHIEMRLDDLDAKADEVLDRLKAMA
ncbi:MAG: hypothetical protein KKA73_07505 [Chloroflexi bacterium]|nr:hypothetical protein [Chloroflexota bacterium]MBU1747517.1 hypothetical protein [Chloroflexota bacterium]MBU1879757.1 hypothetical protein [Chloroflexota bacterium]